MKASVRTRLYLCAAVLLGVVAFAVGSNRSVQATYLCVASADYKNPCRPILGAYASRYTEAGGEYDVKVQSLYHEQRVGKQLDAVHTYLQPSNSALTSAQKYFAARGTLNVINWKPANVWADAGGSNATVNAKIDSMAASVKTVAPQNVMLTIFHEPEDDVSLGGSPSCREDYVYKGSAGTTADYVQMWQNVRNRFEAAGVTNVVWAMNYMGFARHNCMVKDLWPGNENVDWVLWDPYMTNVSQTFSTMVSPFYTFLENNSDENHAFASKPWGLNEWGAFPVIADQNDVKRLYTEAKGAVQTNEFPRLKLYNIFDTYNADGDFRIRYTADGVTDQLEESTYRDFASIPQFTDQYSVETPASAWTKVHKKKS